MRLRIRTAAVAATAATALLLTACGGSGDDDAISGIGGGDSQNEDEPGDEPEDEEPGEETDEEFGDDRPAIELPEDVEIVFDWETPEDPDEAIAAAEARYYIRAIALGIVEQDPEHPVYRGYSVQGAEEYARTQITGWVDGGWTMSGTDRYYDLVTERVNDTVIRVTFCADSSEMPGKDVATGQVLSEETAGKYSDHHLYSLNMWQAPSQDDAFVAQTIVVEESPRCAG